MRTSTLFCICGVVFALLSLSLGFVGKPVPAGLSGLAAGAWCVAPLLMERRGGDDD